jgi:uncharacterized protein YgiM (DUF1202 family)
VIRKLLLGLTVLLILGTAGYIRFRHPKAPMEIGYAGDRQVIVWSSSAQVREVVTTISFGERLDVLQRFQDQVKVRTTSGITGWIEERELLSADVWQTAKDLNKKALSMPIEARGHTKALSNLHMEPGRDSLRLHQLNKNTPLDVLARQSVAVAMPRGAAAGEAPSSVSPGKKEDWWLVLAHNNNQTTMAGWVMGRFIELDVPAPLPDYASSAGMRIVGWFELNRVADASQNAKPQYLLVGTHGAEGQVCDFSLLRVYTWGQKRERYETAFVESDVCGKLPVKIAKASTPGGEVRFEFQNLSGKEAEERKYVMRQTAVRRVREAGETKPAKRKR